MKRTRERERERERERWVLNAIECLPKRAQERERENVSVT